MDGCKIARVLQRGPQSKSAPGTAVIILRGPVIAVAAAPAADGRQRDRIVADERVGLQTLAKCREIAQRLDGGARLAHSLGCTIELAQWIGKASGEDAAGFVLQNNNRSLRRRTDAQVGTRSRLPAAVGHTGQNHIVER